MTLIYKDDAVQGPAVHALVIGVGAYPLAKPANKKAGTPKALRDVADIDSAAKSAELFADWLIGEAKCSLPLGSIAMLKNAQTASGSTYVWNDRFHRPGTDPRPDGLVAVPETAVVKTAGVDWSARLEAVQGSIGILFACGHGGSIGPDPMLFLADLNGDPAAEWGAFLNLGQVATGLKQIPAVAAAHIFVDACGEFIADMVLQDQGKGAKFLKVDPYKKNKEKVSLITAAAANHLAFEDTPESGGRFTISLLRALRGASARSHSGMAEWTIRPQDIFSDLEGLYGIEPTWTDPFEPAAPHMPSKPSTIVQFTEPPTVYRKIAFDPAPAINLCDLMVLDSNGPPPLYQFPKNGSVQWLLQMTASIFPHRLVAEFPGGQYPKMEAVFTPAQSVYDHVMRCGP